MLDDLRYALRSLRSRPGLSLLVVATLALGIGANTAIFSVVDAALLTPLPYRDPDRLLMLREDSAGISPFIPISAAELLAFRSRAGSFSDVAAIDTLDFHVLGEAGPERVAGARVTPDLFPMLGYRAALGNLIEGSTESAPATVLLSHGYWQRRFGGDPDVVGRPLQMIWNARFGPSRKLASSFVVAGILPPDFFSPFSQPDVWVPLVLDGEDVASHNHYLFPFARLSDGADAQAARAELAQLLRERHEAEGENDVRERIDATLVPLTERGVAAVRPGLLLASGAVALVLLIACVNVANLLLVRTAARQEELALRSALGASRARLLRTALLESLILSLAGAAAGLVVAKSALAALGLSLVSLLPRGGEIAIDGTVLAYTLVLLLLTTLLSGLLPALTSYRTAPLQPSSRSRGGTPTSAATRLRSGLVVVEVALSVALLVGAGLLLRSLHRLTNAELGFDRAEEVVTLQLSLPEVRYRERADRAAFYRRLQSRLRELPGVTEVGLADVLPLTTVNFASRFDIQGRPAPEGEVRSANLRRVSAGYFESLGIRLLQGRTFDDGDVDSGDTVIVNRTFWSRFLDGDAPLGIRLDVTASDAEGLEIVGVVEDVRQLGATGEVRPTLYLPDVGGAGRYVALRTDGRTSGLAVAAPAVVAELDPQLPVYSIRTLEQLSRNWISRPRFQTLLVTLFALLALTLASVGIYGLLSFSVTTRGRELGLRMAIGANRRQVVSLVFGQAMRLVAIGLSIGLVMAAFGGRLLASMLYGVTTTDPIAFSTVPMALLLAALVATLLPAVRASRIQPAEALRRE